MKKIIKLYESLVEWVKRLEKEIEEEDRKTDGRFSSALIVFFGLLDILFFVLAFVVFG